MRRPLVLVLLFAFLTACQAGGMQRGLSQKSYLSTTRPAIQLEAKNLPLIGSERRTVKLPNAGFLGGLPLDAWITVYGSQDSAMAIVAHVDLPPGWFWDANMEHPFAVDTTWLPVGDFSFFAQTFMEIPGKNPFVDQSQNEAKKAWLVRSYSARVANDRSKLILEYREPAPEGVTTVQAFPYGQADLLKDFAKRADQTFSAQRPHILPASLAFQAIPHLHTQYISEHFLGTASPIDALSTFAP